MPLGCACSAAGMGWLPPSHVCASSAQRQKSPLWLLPTLQVPDRKQKGRVLSGAENPEYRMLEAAKQAMQVGVCGCCVRQGPAPVRVGLACGMRKHWRGAVFPCAACQARMRPPSAVRSLPPRSSIPRCQMRC